MQVCRAERVSGVVVEARALGAPAVRPRPEAAVAGAVDALHGVTRRAKLQGAICSVGVDWFQATLREEDRGRVERWLRSWWGDPEPVRGKWFYSQGLRWPNGSCLYWGREVRPPLTDRGGFKPAVDGPDGAKAADGEEEVRTACVVIPGGALAEWDLAERVECLRELWERGANHVTRVDVYVEWRGVGLNLIGAMVDACGRGELCRARRWEPRQVRSGSKVVGDSIYIGARGRFGSGRLVRVYDKGLESKSAPWGHWQRCEVEFSGESARGAFAAIVGVEEGEALVVDQDGEIVRSWADVAKGLVLGAVDFREVREGVRSLKRRPRADWWAEVLADVEPLRLQLQRRSRPHYGGWRRWVRRVLSPTLVRMVAEGADAAEVFGELTRGVPAGVTADCRQRVWEYLEDHRTSLSASICVTSSV